MNDLQTNIDTIKQQFVDFHLLPEYERTQVLAIQTAKILKENAHERICDCMWMPFSLLYEQMVKRGELTRIENIGRDRALLYWTSACVSTKELGKRIMIMRALYVYDLITEKI